MREISKKKKLNEFNIFLTKNRLDVKTSNLNFLIK